MVNSILPIAAVLIMGVISPGPSIIHVARNAVVFSRVHGIVTALGTGTGAAIFSLTAMLGLKRLLIMLPQFFVVLKIAGGIYLLYLAFKIFKDAPKPLILGAGGVADNGKNLLSTFRGGLLIQLSNPKTAIIFASIFSALLPEVIPVDLYLIIPVMSFLIDFIWGAAISTALSSEKARIFYQRIKSTADRTTSLLMAVLGIKLISSSFTS